MSGILATAAQAEQRRQDHPLIALIKQQQRVHVRESWGEWDYQCFTWDDLRWFQKEDVPAEITKKLAKDAKFAAIVRGIKEMKPAERNKLLKRASRTYKPTWAQLGRITRAGQTDAGQEAERLIAGAIVQLVTRTLGRPQ